MPWKLPEEHDSKIRHWMKTKGWEVSCTNFDSDRKVYAWRHDVRGGPPPTLRISRTVLENYPAFVLLYHLDEMKVARTMRAEPEARIVVAQQGSTVVLDEER